MYFYSLQKYLQHAVKISCEVVSIIIVILMHVLTNVPIILNVEFCILKLNINLLIHNSKNCFKNDLFNFGHSSSSYKVEYYSLNVRNSLLK